MKNNYNFSSTKRITQIVSLCKIKIQRTLCHFFILLVCLIGFCELAYCQNTKEIKSKMKITTQLKKTGLKLQLIRNATMKLTYAGKTFLTDPMFSAKGTFEPFAGIARNPTIDLPIESNEILKRIDCVIVSHLHPDHFDQSAIKVISKQIPVFCQAGDNDNILANGFNNVISIENSYTWDGIEITRIGGKHGRGKILEFMGKVSGFVFQAKGEPTIYWIGDSIWCDEVKNAIEKYNPDIIITHSGGAKIPNFEKILMDGKETLTICNLNSNAVIVAVHLESLDHCTVSRKNLREMADKEKISPSRLLIPEDGETIVFE